MELCAKSKDSEYVCVRYCTVLYIYGLVCCSRSFETDWLEKLETPRDQYRNSMSRSGSVGSALACYGSRLIFSSMYCSRNNNDHHHLALHHEPPLFLICTSTVGTWHDNIFSKISAPISSIQFQVLHCYCLCSGIRANHMEQSESFDSQICLLILVKTLQATVKVRVTASIGTVSIGCEDRNPLRATCERT